MKYLALFLLIACNDITHKSNVNRPYRIYFPESGAIYCRYRDRYHNLGDCVDYLGEKKDDIYNATNYTKAD